MQVNLTPLIKGLAKHVLRPTDLVKVLVHTYFMVDLIWIYIYIYDFFLDNIYDFVTYGDLMAFVIELVQRRYVRTLSVSEAS